MKIISLCSAVLFLAPNVWATSWVVVGASQFISYMPLVKTIELKKNTSMSEIAIRISGDSVFVEKVEILNWKSFYSSNSYLSGNYSSGDLKIAKLSFIEKKPNKLRIEIQKNNQTDEIVFIEVLAR